MKIRYLDVQNFQSYQRVRIPLSDFTIIVGQSSAGKSSLLRMLQFLFYNSWDNTFPNDATKPTIVAITMENGTKIIRMRKGTVNSAAIVRGSDITKFKSFGDTIPGIYNLINVRPIDIGGKDVNLNFSLQDDPIFMVAESRPTRAQWLGRLYGAHMVNIMLRDMAKDKRATESKRKDSEERLAMLKSDMVQYSDIEKHELALEECKGLIDQAMSIQKICDAKEMLRSEKESIDADSYVVNIDTAAVKSSINMLSKLIEIKDKRQDLIVEKKFLISHKSIMKMDLGKLKTDIETYAEMSAAKARLATTFAASKELEARRVVLLGRISLSKKNMNEQLFVAGKCPICQSSVTPGSEESLTQNIKHLLKQ